jgi:DNA-binding transcriptional regulator GbsR (MarR family)
MEMCSLEKKLLIEEVAHHLESHRKLPPLASRIYAIMILSSDEGFSFEELISITLASKSSTSASLNLLTQLSFVESYTKPGERKRHFRGTGNYLKSTLEEHFHNVEYELQIVEKINRFNRNSNPDKFVADESLGSLFQDYLNLQKSNLQFTLKKMIEFKTETHQ